MSRSPCVVQLVPGNRDLVLADPEKPAELDDAGAHLAVRVDQDIVEFADLFAVRAIDVLADEFLDFFRDRVCSRGRRDSDRTGAGA